MARYGQSFKDRAVARLLPPESAALDVVGREVGVGSETLQRWRDAVSTRPERERIWTAGARLEAVIATAALAESSKSAWCREQSLYPADLERWRVSATAALATPAEARASPQATRQDILAARHALYTAARARNPARWYGETRNWSPILTVTLNPERDSIIKTHLDGIHTLPLAA